MKLKQTLSKLVAPFLLGTSLQATAGTFLLSGDTTRTLSSEPVTAIVRIDESAHLNLILKLLNGMVLDEIPDANTYLVSLPSMPFSVPYGVQMLELNTHLSLPVELEVGVLEVPSDTAALWYSEQQAFQIVRVPEAHDFTRGQGVIVADIDSKFDHEHPALASRFVDGFDFVEGNPEGAGALNQSSTSYMFEGGSADLYQSSTSYMFEGADTGLFQSSTSYMFENDLFQSSTSYMFEEYDINFLDNSVVGLLTPAGAGLSHGTFTAGIIAATAPDAKIMPLRTFDDEGKTDLFSLAKAIRYAVDHGADVINMSWGTSTDSEAIRSAIQHAAAEGVVLVASAGNMNSEYAYYPAAYEEVIAVAATDDLDHKASFSSYGEHVLVSAPGVNIISAYPGGSYAIKSGTSFSAPMISGQAALMKSLYLKDIKKRVAGTSVEIDAKNPAYQDKLGEGRTDVMKSIEDGYIEEVEPPKVKKPSYGFKIFFSFGA